MSFDENTISVHTERRSTDENAFFTKNSEAMQNEELEQMRTRCEVYTRVMWYYRPVSRHNIWKKSEFYSREYYDWRKALKKCEPLNDDCLLYEQ